MTEFERSLAKVLVHEGGFSNHPKDPGGATMRFVTQKVYDGWRVANGHSKRTVKLITTDELQAIHRKLYWDVNRCDKLAPGLPHVVRRWREFRQRAVRQVAAACAAEHRARYTGLIEAEDIWLQQPFWWRGMLVYPRRDHINNDMQPRNPDGLTHIC